MNGLASSVDEKAFIGCAVASAGDTLDSYCPEAEAFSEPVLRGVYRIVLDLHRKGEPISAETVMSRLGDGVNHMGIFSIWEVCFYPATSMAGQFYKSIVGWHALRKARMLGEKLVQETEGFKTLETLEDFCKTISTDAARLMPDTACDNVLGSACGELDTRLDALERGEAVTGLKTPLEAWNSAFGGICAGGMYGLASRPGLGKTALMEQMVGMLLMEEKPILVFEKDMSPRVLIERMACRFAKVPYWRLAKGILNPHDIAEIRRFNEALRTSSLLLYNPSGLTAEQMGAITRREQRLNGVVAVFLDHVTTLNVGKDLREGLTAASLTIRRTCTETNIPHIILAHINRNGAKGRPMPEDIKEFDQLLGDCDGMALLWTDEDKTQVKAGELLKMKLFFAKNRNGPVAEEQVLFDGPMMSFRNSL